jgi:hypothetical protein
MEDREYTIEAIMLVGECPDKPSEWLIWDSEFPVEFSSFFVEPYCPCIAEEEHRIFPTMPQYGNSFTWLYSCSAELNLQGVMSIGPLSIPNRLKSKLQEMPSMLRQQLSLVESTVPSLLNGNIYRVDCCMAGEVDYEDLLENSWVINEMQLVPVAQTFISSYHHNGPQANLLADGFVSYIVKYHHPYYPA